MNRSTFLAPGSQSRGVSRAGLRVVALVGLFMPLALAVVGNGPETRTADRRVSWTSSRIRGAPEPPRPYVAEPAFPRVKHELPLVLAQPPGIDRLFVGEQNGRVVSFPIDPDVDRVDVAIDLAERPTRCEALYGLAFHPRFAENRQVFLCYVTRTGDPDGTRVSRFKVTADQPPRIDRTSEEVIITWLGGGHNGGCLDFGTDGFLYISTGDGEGPSPPDVLLTGQDLTDLLSSILRIDVDHAENGRAYRVPPDNPFVSLAGARPEIWAYGFRNPWRMSIDRRTGALWVGDVGWDLWEMIYRVERGGNYGWSATEGPQPVRPDGPRGPTPILPPTVAHPHSEAASITGGYVYHGTRLPELAGAYVYGDYQSGKIWAFREGGEPNAKPLELADTGIRLASFGEDQSGELYLVEHDHTNQIYRLVPNPAPAPTHPFPRHLSETGLFASTVDHTPARGVIPYVINAAAWADGTTAERWLAIPGDGRIVSQEGRWKLPEGSVLARTVSIVDVSGRSRRLETQILHLEESAWRPYTYVWNDEQSDGELVSAEGMRRVVSLADPASADGTRLWTYRIPARSECALCHNPWVEAQTTIFGRQSASPLGFDRSQLDRRMLGSAVNQLEHLAELGVLDRSEPGSGSTQPLADPYDEHADLGARARSYLHVNCSHCHQFNAGGSATIVLGANVPLAETKTINERPTQGTFGNEGARIIAPGSPERSVLLYRLAKTGSGHMPRAGSTLVDVAGVRLMTRWIESLAPGTSAHAPKLARLHDANGKEDICKQLISDLAETTSGALALACALDRGGLDESVTSQAAALARTHPRTEVRDLLERFLPWSERGERLGDGFDMEQLVATPGDADRGLRWFYSEAASSACRSCHTVEEQGANVGPNLKGIGAKYSPRDLLKHIVQPSLAVDPAYATHVIAISDGRILSGRIAERDERRLVLIDAKDQRTVVPVDQVEQESTAPTSLMPEGLLRDLTAQEAADLLAYLNSLRAAVP